MTGSEGTLVAITEATVGLIELPQAKMFAVGHFESVDDAIAATEDALALEAAAIEMIDSTILELSRSKLEFARMSETIQGRPGALLFVTCVHLEQSAGLVAGAITAGSAGTLWGALPLARWRTPSRSWRTLKSPAYSR